ncbi:MAG: sensor histidine kinase [Silicimonas sp.]|nr:sensor histidine kinase [Silicimonas sp.]
MARTTGILGFLLAVAAFMAAIWVYSLGQSLSALERRGQSDLSLATDSLISELASYRQLAVSLAGEPRIRSRETAPEVLEAELRRVADLSGALDLVLLDREAGYVGSASGIKQPDWADRPFVARAFQGTVGRDLMVSPAFGRRTFLYAVPVFSVSGPVTRVLTILIDLERVEADFRGSRPAVLMTDHAGTIFFSNRSELVLGSRAALIDAFEVDQGAGRLVERGLDNADLWSVSAGRYLPARALHIEKDLPVIGMRAEALVDAAPAFSAAGLQAAVAGIACLLFGAIITFVASQRRTLAEANEVLEQRVAQRTEELSETNVALRAEVVERREAEKALKQTQAALIQSGKLSALGKMSAGISHELNQPLMAIRSFSENAETFLERGDTKAVASNLSRVGDLAHRMGRIINNLRAFARQEPEAVGKVDLVQAIHAAIDLVDARLRKHDVTLDLDVPETPLWVQGGEVRLQQVVLNLVSNAIDAMAESDTRKVHLVARPGPPVVLTIQDTGPGIAEPDKVFEPFYTTKSIGEAEGVGLGLSISYGLVQSFGGNISGRNADDGGAIFEVELNPYEEVVE